MSFTVFLGNLPAWVTADDIKGWLTAENLVADAAEHRRDELHHPPVRSRSARRPAAARQPGPATEGQGPDTPGWSAAALGFLLQPPRGSTLRPAFKWTSRRAGLRLAPVNVWSGAEQSPAPSGSKRPDRHGNSARRTGSSPRCGTSGPSSAPWQEERQKARQWCASQRIC
jgi:hypothetical protein